MPSSETLAFQADPEVFIATLARVAATQGDAAMVAVLVESEARIELTYSESDLGEEWNSYTLRLLLDPSVYGMLGAEREPLANRLQGLAREVSEAHDRHNSVGTVALAPALRPADGWRPGAKSWLRGEGINNQGRVRSDNIAARQQDRLLFRSQPEIHLYEALKSRGVYLAPLPVSLRGGKEYQRLEPDFVLLYKGVVMVVEVDGATVHRESPAEAHARVQGLIRDGVRVERVDATACGTRADAERCADKLMEALDGYRALRV